MRVSVITAVRNGATTIADALDSVSGQCYSDLEHVVVDGASTDGTVDIVHERIRSGGSVASEPDSGIYDAFNKGFRRSSGEVVAYLGADDFYSSRLIIKQVVACFEQTGVDAVFGDAAFIRSTLDGRYVRRYRSNIFTPALVPWGFMPAHSALFVRRNLMERFGAFDSSYRIAGDFELIARLFVLHGATYSHIPELFTVMRIGGASSSGYSSTQVISKEILRACKQNGIYSNELMVRARYLWKLRELVAPGRPSAEHFGVVD